MKGVFAEETCRAAGLTSPEFWLSTCRRNLLDYSLWLQLPTEFRADAEFLAVFRLGVAQKSNICFAPVLFVPGTERFGCL